MFWAPRGSTLRGCKVAQEFLVQHQVQVRNLAMLQLSAGSTDWRLQPQRVFAYTFYKQGTQTLDTDFGPAVSSTAEPNMHAWLAQNVIATLTGSSHDLKLQQVFPRVTQISQQGNHMVAASSPEPHVNTPRSPAFMLVEELGNSVTKSTTAGVLYGRLRPCGEEAVRYNRGNHVMLTPVSRGVS